MIDLIKQFANSFQFNTKFWAPQTDKISMFIKVYITSTGLEAHTVGYTWIYE